MNNYFKDFLDFCNTYKGVNFYCKKTGNIIYKFELYWKNISPAAIHNRYISKERPQIRVEY